MKPFSRRKILDEQCLCGVSLFVLVVDRESCSVYAVNNLAGFVLCLPYTSRRRYASSKAMIMMYIQKTKQKCKLLEMEGRWKNLK